MRYATCARVEREGVTRTIVMIWKGDAWMDQDRERDQHEASGREQREAASNPPAGEQQGKGPFLRQMSEVERQGVPEPGATNPGPPPKPVRSGDFRVGHTPTADPREER